MSEQSSYQKMIARNKAQAFRRDEERDDGEVDDEQDLDERIDGEPDEEAARLRMQIRNRALCNVRNDSSDDDAIKLQKRLDSASSWRTDIQISRQN